MSHSDGPGSTPPDSPQQRAPVISLCDHRTRRSIEAAGDELVAHLEHIHHRAVQVHNAVIERAGLSVLSELSRTAGLFLDRVDDELRTAVLIPAALYGDCSGAEIFGKKPLQQRIEEDIEDPDAARLLRCLNCTHCAVWEYEVCDDEPMNRITSLAGCQDSQSRSIAGIVCRSGVVQQQPGVYTGRLVEFRDHEFIVFGYRLDRCREVAVRDMLTGLDDRRTQDVWPRVQLPLLRAIVDPDNNHQWPGHDGLERRQAVRQPASRNGLLLRIRRELWRHFAEPDEGLTLHAHIAALVDDIPAYEALIDEIAQIAETVTMKCGGLREGAAPIEPDEILRPFYADVTGRLEHRGRLQRHPSAVLLLPEVVFEATGLDRRAPIGAALQWAHHHEQTAPARSIELAWMTYRTEQNLVATYGCGIGAGQTDESRRDSPCFARRSPVLPNIRTLFDPRFMEHSLADLSLERVHRRALAAKLSQKQIQLHECTLDELGRDERQLTRRWGVGAETCNAVRVALLRLATQWRWQRCGFDVEQSTGSNDSDFSGRDTGGGVDAADD